MTTNYTGEQIEVLRGLEAVRKRPGMYIGNTAERGLHQLVYEAVDNAVDEALAGYAQNVRVILLQRRLVLGRGRRARHPDRHSRRREAAGGRGRHDDPPRRRRSSARADTRSRAACTASASRSSTRSPNGWSRSVKRDGWLWEMKFERGITVQKLKKIGKTDGTGTLQWFKPDTEMFEVTEFHWDILQKRLRELAFLNRGLSITLRDERGETVRERNVHVRRRHRLVRRVAQREEGPAAPDHLDARRARRRRRRGGDAVHGHVRRSDLLVREQHRHDRRRHAPHGLPAGRDQRGQRVRAQARHAQGVRQLALDRRHHGRADGRRLGEAARSAVRRARRRPSSATRGCAASSTGLVYERLGVLLRRESEVRARDRRQVHAGAARARSGEESARSLAPQERARGLGSARQARRLQEQQPRARASSSWSRAIRPAAPPRAAAIRTRKRSCRCAARSSTSRRRAWTRCSPTKRSAR